MKHVPRFSLTQGDAPEDAYGDNFATLRLILKKPISQRNSKSIQILVSFVRNIKFFTEVRKQMSEDAVVQCCHYMAYEFVKRGQYVFRQGEQGEKFYVILEGECGVQVRGESETNEVAVLGRGDSFGELGLLNNKGRAASILCRDDTHFAVLCKDDYERILLKIHQQKLSEKVDFLMALPFFGLCTNYAMQKLSYYFQEISIARKHAVARCGDSVSSLYFIREGEMQLVKDVKIPTERATGLKSGKSLACHIEVALLSKGECIGFEEVIYGKPYQYTALCYSTTAKLLVISKEVNSTQDFLKRVNADDALKHAEELLEDKKAKYQNRINSMQCLYRKRNNEYSRPPVVTGDSESLKTAGSHLKSITKSDYYGVSVAIPEKRSAALSTMRLYPLHSVSQRADSAPKEKPLSVRGAPWDVLLTKKLLKLTISRSFSAAKHVNIHTLSLKRKKQKSFGSLMESAMTSPQTARDTSRHLLTINSHEAVTDRADESSATPRSQVAVRRSNCLRLQFMRERSLL